GRATCASAARLGPQRRAAAGARGGAELPRLARGAAARQSRGAIASASAGLCDGNREDVERDPQLGRLGVLLPGPLREPAWPAWRERGPTHGMLPRPPPAGVFAVPSAPDQRERVAGILVLSMAVRLGLAPGASGNERHLSGNFVGAVASRPPIARPISIPASVTQDDESIGHGQMANLNQAGPRAPRRSVGVMRAW